VERNTWKKINWKKMHEKKYMEIKTWKQIHKKNTGKQINRNKLIESNP